MIAQIDLQIETSGKTNTTVHGRRGIKTFTLPLSQAIEKAREIIIEEFESFKGKSTCSCGNIAPNSTSREKLRLDMEQLKENHES